jgi:hypothetical protein
LYSPTIFCFDFVLSMAIDSIPMPYERSSAES